MKRTVPLLIAAICGFVLIITAFIPATVTWGETATVWFDVLAAIAFILGGGNLLKVHLRKVSDRAAGWAYSLITVVTFLLTLGVGLLKWGVPPGSDQEFFGYSFASLSVADLPEELTFRLPVDLPGDLAAGTLPASVRRQLRMTFAENDSQRLGTLEFHGWMTSSQKSDLLGFHDLLDWKCAVEQLAERSAPPASLAGKVSYFAEHEALAISGTLPEATEQELRAISATQPWTAAVTELARLARAPTSRTLQYIPSGLQVPSSREDSLKLQGQTLTVIGPMTPEMRAELTDVFPRVRPLAEQEIERFVADMGDTLSEDQQNLLRGMLGSLWNAEQLITVLNDAGKSQPVKKTYCELRAEQLAGVDDLSPTRDSSEPDTQLNAAQVEALTAAVMNPEVNLRTLGSVLSELGPWIPSQESALQKFRQRLPTIGQRNRTLVAALTLGDGQLPRATLDLLLAPYREEHLWNNEVFALYEAAHRVKYAWSGGYLQDGSPFWWSYEYAFKPLTATMFALLAFYVASAAFRAFRAKNLEAFLLLATAFIILLGRTPTGVWLTSGLPDSLSILRIENMTAFILSVINTAGNRAIMIGIALGIVSTSLKILLGVDRSYLGSGD
ncbi:MAG: ECF transporter S component [Planctomycetaceae bacterium]|nr:ECF transporter S component [Planctomycetaceae bacterium]